MVTESTDLELKCRSVRDERWHLDGEPRVTLEEELVDARVERGEPVCCRLHEEGRWHLLRARVTARGVSAGLHALLELLDSIGPWILHEKQRLVWRGALQGNAQKPGMVE